MSTPLDDYKQFIDAVAGLTGSVAARRVREGGSWPDLPENTRINHLIGSITDEQREALATLLDSACTEGMHRLLAYLNDEIALGGLRLTRGGRELPVEPFGTELYYDWVCRRASDPWPDERGRAAET